MGWVTYLFRSLIAPVCADPHPIHNQWGGCIPMWYIQPHCGLACSLSRKPLRRFLWKIHRYMW